MSYVENPSNKVDSEMEEGEIVDDELSDISSEEEYFLLRKRLYVLEKYNNVLERTKAKRSSMESGTTKSKTQHLPDLSKITTKKLKKSCLHKNNKHTKPLNKPKKPKVLEENLIVQANIGKHKNKRKVSRNKRKMEVTLVSESSEESEDEYKNKRWKLANAVNINKQTSDKSTLKARLNKMLCKVDSQDLTKSSSDNKLLKYKIDQSLSPISDEPFMSTVLHEEASEVIINNNAKEVEFVDISDDDVKILEGQDCKDIVDAANTLHITHSNKNSDKDTSDEDLELLRQHALNTKTIKQSIVTDLKNIQESKILLEDEDSDTAELRLICLKSALLKKAIEKKQKQKLKKRLSQSSLHDNMFQEQNILLGQMDLANNTDTESVDMEIGSDGDEKGKEVKECDKEWRIEKRNMNVSSEKNIKTCTCANLSKEDEFEEDEDLLRAKLLTSLSKNFPNLLTPLVNNVEEVHDVNHLGPPPPVKVKQKNEEIPQKRFIINVGESDSEEHEATKNLTKMHMKLSNQNEFQERLDMFLKSTRMEVEKKKLPDVVQEPAPKKYVAKAVNNLPKYEQIEYKNLVKRMAELEKIKQARQSSINLSKKTAVKDTLKPRNFAIKTNLNAINDIEDQIAKSRKKIAEESAKILKLKEEGTKLSRKYKIVATELWNITTAITLNKKQQRALQNSLTKIRLHHQSLLRSSTMTKHSKINTQKLSTNQHPKLSAARLQKENNPSKKEDSKNANMLKNVKVTYDGKNDINSLMYLAQNDVPSKKAIFPKSSTKEKHLEVINKEHIETNNNKSNEDSKLIVENDYIKHSAVEKCDENSSEKFEFIDDYRSPLEALGSTNWKADPDAILCPFEIGGDCKDPDCKYLHTNIPSSKTLAQHKHTSQLTHK